MDYVKQLEQMLAFSLELQDVAERKLKAANDELAVRVRYIRKRTVGGAACSQAA